MHIILENAAEAQSLLHARSAPPRRRVHDAWTRAAPLPPHAAGCATAVPLRTPMNAHRVAAATRSKANSIANSGS